MCKSYCASGRRASLETTVGSHGYCALSIAVPKLLKMAELMRAVRTGDFNFVCQMFSVLSEDEVARATTYQTPETKETLLFSACVKGNLEMVRFLLAMGRGKSDLYTAWGAGPLHAAAERCHEAVVRLLLKNGADINAQTTYGDTPVQLAAYRGHYTVVKCLVEAGCDLDIRNSKGRTALDDATQARHDRIVRYLTAVMYPDTNGLVETAENRKMANNTEDLMKTRPLVAPGATHQRLDRSISWHSYHDNCSWQESSDGDTSPSWTTTSFGPASSVESDSSMNDLSVGMPNQPRWDAHNNREINIIPEIPDQPRQGGTAVRPMPGAGSCAEKRRDYYWGRRASDSRVEYLERMVARLQLGLTATQEELGRTRCELKRANDKLRSLPRQRPIVHQESVPAGKDAVRLLLNLRDRDVTQYC